MFIKHFSFFQYLDNPINFNNSINHLTENGVITNYPHKKLLNSKKVATRADVCALLYRAMVSTGEVPDLPAK